MVVAVVVEVAVVALICFYPLAVAGVVVVVAAVVVAAVLVLSGVVFDGVVMFGVVLVGAGKTPAHLQL